MHELSVAMSLVDVVMEHVIEAKAERVRRVVVEVGELSGVVPAALRSAFVVAISQEEALRGAELDLRPVAVAIYCDACAAEQPAVGPQAIRCATCGRPSAVVVRGRELDVISIEVDNAAPNARRADEDPQRKRPHRPRAARPL